LICQKYLIHKIAYAYILIGLELVNDQKDIN
jgi:hypothetical protein